MTTDGRICCCCSYWEPDEDDDIGTCTRTKVFSFDELDAAKPDSWLASGDEHSQLRTTMQFACPLWREEGTEDVPFDDLSAEHTQEQWVRSVRREQERRKEEGT
jgi:hypothetical protein